MKSEKSFDIGVKLKGKKIEEYLLLPNIEVDEIIEKEWKGDNFHSTLPNNKYGVYVVYDNDKCLYVGETKSKNGFKGRFKDHYYLKEFRSRATKIIMYIISKEKHNDRVLFEKLKIKELNPILNRAEEREISINYSNKVLVEIEQYVRELIDIFGDDEDNRNTKSEEMEAVVIKNVRKVKNILDQVNPKEFVYGDNLEDHIEGGMSQQLNYKSIKVIDCMMCNGDKECDICLGNGKLIGEKLCNDCDGIGFSEKSNKNGYCKTCRGTGFSSFKVFNEREHIKLSIEKCKICESTGKDVDGDLCKECNGARFIIIEELDE